METIDGSASSRRQGSNSDVGRDRRVRVDEDRFPALQKSNFTLESPLGGAAPSMIAPSVIKSTAGSSVFSEGVASSTFDPQAHERALKEQMKRYSAALGAYPVTDNADVFYEDDDEDEEETPDNLNRLMGAYEVLAPSGPIGIVVDTTERGPVVHSLKKGSPMQGLINPGDFIVALDGEDVRKLNAATLTKLMAKKASQAERKFMLLPSDNI